VDQEARLRRRAQARRRIHRRRRLALGCLVALAGLASAGAALFLGGGDEESRARGTQPAPPELPGGGRRILPDRRVVAFYGAPQDPELGALGAGRPAAVARRLRRQARPYTRRGRPLLPAFELITTIVTSAPGDGGDYSQRQSPAAVRRYLRAARRHGALLILDIQPGRAPFMREVRAMRRFLAQPDVSLALDPEWSMAPGELPGQQIGSTDAATVNEVSAYLSRIVRRLDLPQKLLVVHRFTDDMIENEAALRRHPGVALVVNVDGFGDQPNKIAKYRAFTRGRRRGGHHGFKLFYREDTDLMRPRQVLGLRPAPDLIVYE
jgi:hypothetical protein